MPDSKAEAADKKRQAAVDKRGYYTLDDQRYIARTGNAQDRARMKKPRRKRRAAKR